MGIEIVGIDPTRRIATVTASGPITRVDIEAHLTHEHTRGLIVYRELIEARSARPDVSTDDIRQIVDELRGYAADGLVGATAVVVATDYAYGIMRMVQALAEEVCAIHPFRDMPEAAAWLLEQPTYPPAAESADG